MSGKHELPDMVVLDTCVLISNALRWLLLRLCSHGCFRPVWSPIIGDEWRRNVGRIWDIGHDDACARWDVLQQAFPRASQDDIAVFKEGLTRSDPKDRHVIAAGRAALASQPGARVAVLTRNLKDFNRSELRRLGLELFDPDRFLVDCLWCHPELVAGLLASLPNEVDSASQPAITLADLLKRERLFRLNRVIVLPDYGNLDAAAQKTT